MEENWKPVVGFEGAYEVSDQGNVRSIDRSYEQISRHGTKYMHSKKGRLLRPGRTSSGHLSVALGRGNSRTVHSLVMEAFVGPRPDKMEICHNNGNPADNRLENLRYATRSENILDAVKLGTWHSEKRKEHWRRLASPSRTEARRFASYKAWERRRSETPS